MWWNSIQLTQMVLTVGLGRHILCPLSVDAGASPCLAQSSMMGAL